MDTFTVTISNLGALQSALALYPSVALPVLQKAVEAGLAILAKNTTPQTVPVRTGYLVQNWGADVGLMQASWYPKAAYACVFDAHTEVITDNGRTPISAIKVGDRVLTQDGQFHTILAANAFPATEKPDLVDIEVEYRNGRTHKLTLTRDHKVLVYRNGRNKWVEAGQLLKTDMLFDRIKVPHNKGTRRVYKCLNCEREHQGQGESFCSLSCRNAFWRTHGNPHVGTTRSEASRENMSAAQKARLARHPELHPNHMMAKAGYRTAIETQVEQWLMGLNIQYLSQFRIGTHWVDFFIPAWNTAFECDGAYWHRDQDRDTRRDKELIAAMPELRVVHIHFFSERHTPLLTPKPMRHVSYVAVNPSMHSYTDLDTFRPRKLVSLRKWRYKRVRGHKSAMLYDLSVEGMHSFVANGLLISNSYVEFGAAPHIITVKNRRVLANAETGQIFGPVVNHPGTAANPFIERIMAASQDEINGIFEAALQQITETVQAA